MTFKLLHRGKLRNRAATEPASAPRRNISNGPAASLRVGVGSIYSNISDPRTEAVLLEFGVFKLNHVLTNGRTLIKDMRLRPSEGVNATLSMQVAWNTVRAPLLTMGNLWANVSRELALFVAQAKLQEQRLHSALDKLVLKSDDHVSKGGSTQPCPCIPASLCKPLSPQPPKTMLV